VLCLCLTLPCLPRPSLPPQPLQLRWDATMGKLDDKPCFGLNYTSYRYTAGRVGGACMLAAQDALCRAVLC